MITASASLQTNILNKLCISMDTLVRTALNYDGLFPSVLDRQTGTMLGELPAPIHGQRNGDRSYPGSNLIHDEALLQTMYTLSEVLGRKSFAAAADMYLARFAEHCTNTTTGLFPWGEHAFWNLVDDRVNDDAIHDHLRQVPLWLWEKLYACNPRCVERFAEGLDYHWTEDEPLEYSRHAWVTVNKHPERGSRSCDFPRHGGFYIFDWAFAYLKTGREDFLRQIHRILDYWWTRREGDGPLYCETRSPEHALQLYKVYAPGQTLSLGTSLLESAELLDSIEPDLASCMRLRGQTYVRAFLDSPRDSQNGMYLLAYKPGVDEATLNMPIWGSIYGVWPASYMALTSLATYRLMRDERLLEWSAEAGRCYIEEAFPSDRAVPAMDSGLALGLLADLYDITGDRQWLEGGLALAQELMDAYYDGVLPRGAAGIDWYESQMGPGFLVHGLARIVLLSIDPDNCPLEADYTAR